MEKEFLLLNGLEKCGIKTHAIGFSHSEQNRSYFNKVYAKHALYTYSFGHKRSLYQGDSYIAKMYSNFFLFLWFSVRLYRTLRERPTSVIIIPPDPLELTLPAVILAKIFGIRVVPNIMEYGPALPSFYKKKNILVRWSWELITKYSDAYIVISSFLEEKIRLLSQKPLFRLPAILPPKTTDEGRNLTDRGYINSEALFDSAPILIFTSSQAYDDLLGFCIDALSRLRDRNFHLIITGEYSSDTRTRWIAKAKELGLEGKISFSGFLSDEEMYKLQVRSKALLMPLLNNEQHRARFPQKILGYMRLGKPIITTKVGDLGEYFKDNVSVIMDESASIAGLSEKIGFLLQHPDQATEIGLRGSEYVESKFSYTSLGKELANFLFRLTDS